MRKDTPYKNNKNQLTGLTPVFSGWTQNPGTNADLVDEVFSKVLTTSGNAGAGATITYDLGTPARLSGFVSNQYADNLMFGSLDSITWRQLTISGSASFAGVYRYIQMKSTGAHAAIAYLKFLVYLI